MPDRSIPTSRFASLVIGALWLGLAGSSFTPRVANAAHPHLPAPNVTVSGRPRLLHTQVSGNGVFIYFLPPPRYRVVARLNATGYGSLNGPHVGMDYQVIERLRLQAERLGANGVLLERLCGVSCVIHLIGHASAPVPSDFWVYRAQAIRVPSPACPFPAKLCNWLEPSRSIAERARYHRFYFMGAHVALTTPSLPKSVLTQSVGQVKQTFLSCHSEEELYSADLGLGPSRTPSRLEARVGRNGRVETVRIIQMGKDTMTPEPSLLWTLRRWRFQPLMVRGKPHAFDLLLLLKSISWNAWHQKHEPYICRDAFHARTWAPTWHVFLPKDGSDALPLAVASRHPSR
ncbi:MAG: hypothetical protein ACYCS1_10885 [Gammaproteobacteria bacterium]